MEEKIKKSTYHRYKQERIDLMNEIRELIENPESLKALEIKIKYQNIFQLERVIWYGSPTIKK